MPHLGKVAIMVEGVPEEHIPELLVNEGADPSTIGLVEGSADDRVADGAVNRSVSFGGNATGRVIVTGDGNRVSKTGRK
jgi:hypothetical protein